MSRSGELCCFRSDQRVNLTSCLLQKLAAPPDLGADPRRLGLDPPPLAATSLARRTARSRRKRRSKKREKKESKQVKPAVVESSAEKVNPRMPTKAAAEPVKVRFGVSPVTVETINS